MTAHSQTDYSISCKTSLYYDFKDPNNIQKVQNLCKEPIMSQGFYIPPLPFEVF